MNVFKYEMKTYLKSILIWSVSISTLLFIFFAIYPTFGTDVELMEKIMEHYPEEMLKAFGMSTELPLSSVHGYMVFTFAFAQLLFAMQAGNYGFAILSVEEREFTADFLMSKPVSRVQILTSKFLAAWIALVVTILISGCMLLVSIMIFSGDHPYETRKIIVLLSSLLFFQMTFLSIGMVVSVILRRIRNVLSFSLGLAFGTYIMNALRAIIGGEILGYVSPFYHFDPAYILINGHYNISMALISIAVIIVSWIGTFTLYLRRDIYSL
jgi:ABC-2 type transport system permease protein